MRMLFEEWMREGKISPYCQSCTHFLARTEPRTVKQPEVYPSDALIYTGKFVNTYTSTPICNECFYHDDGTPSHYLRGI